MVRSVAVHRAKVIRPTPGTELGLSLAGARFVRLERRGKYLLFTLRRRGGGSIRLLGHLGLTGRMYCLPPEARLPKHVAVSLDLGGARLVFEDTRYFGRFTLDLSALKSLGPEPLGPGFGVRELSRALGRSRQAVKVKLLDQGALAGVGNIYASEALYQARISPRRPASALGPDEVRRLWTSLRRVLRQAIRGGSTVPPVSSGPLPGLFYHGRRENRAPTYEDRLCVYDREGQPCRRCAAPIRRISQGGRSTYYCPRCQQEQ
jgi:formamidopyrimidine-DNA glycosylase